MRFVNALAPYRGRGRATVADRFSESYPAAVESVARARSAIAEFAAAAGIDGEQLDAVRLTVSEAVTNVVVHGYPDSEGTFNVTATASVDQVRVAVVDDGRGLRMGSQHPGLGLGLPLMARLSDGFAVEPSASGGVEVRLSFARP
jgi:anti-sigma regulatory factor (Ser/Thr protein kinase)